MLATLSILALANLGVSLVTKPVDLAPLNFPKDTVNNMLSARDFDFSADCPAEPNSCGVVTYKSGTYTDFGQGTCMKVGSDVASIYVTKCFCSLWKYVDLDRVRCVDLLMRDSTCEGTSNDVFVDGMMMCQAPKKSDEFSKEIRYISCGGLN